MPLYDKVLKSMQEKIRSGEWAAGEINQTFEIVERKL